MIPKITFLGTGADSYLCAKQILSSCGIVLHIDDMQLVLDPGVGTVLNINKNDLNVRETTGVILSSNDLMFSNDSNAVVDAMTFGGFDVRGIIIANNTAMFGDNSEQPVVFSSTKNKVEKYIVLNPSQRVGINNVEIKAFESFSRQGKEVLPNSNSLIYKFIINDMSISYVGLSAYSSKISENLKNSSILILSLLDFDEYSRDDSINVKDAENLIKEINPNLAIITNFGIKVFKQDLINIARELHKNTGVEVISAKDGLSITPNTYIKKSKQTSLSGFSSKVF